MKYQTKPRTDEIIPNENICFPIGTILAVKNKYEKFDFSDGKTIATSGFGSIQDSGYEKDFRRV